MSSLAITLENYDCGIAYVKFIEMLNAELDAQKSEERFSQFFQNDGRLVFTNKKSIEFVKENYPNDNEPFRETLEDWKK